MTTDPQPDLDQEDPTMTTTTEAPPAAAPEAPPIPTTVVDVPDLGRTIGEADLHEPSMTKDDLHAVLRVLGMPAPKSARKSDLITWAVNGLRLKAMVEGAPAPAALPPAPDPEAAAPPIPLEATPDSIVPTPAKFQQIIALAEFFAKSNLTPDAIRGKPHDVGHILFKAHDLGVPLTMALDQMYVIKGRVGMESKLMRALIRRDGHNIKDLGCDGYRAQVWGRRVDNGDEHVAEFTLDDALDQELIAGWEEVEAGVFRTKPVMNNGKSVKPQWQRDTKNMLVERATARLARFLFSDCLAGVSYTPDELGYVEYDEAGPTFGRAGEAEPTMTIKQQRDDIARRINELPEDLRLDLRDNYWKQRNFPKPSDLPPAAISQVLRWLVDFEAKAAAREQAEADVPEAEVIPDADGTTPDADNADGPEEAEVVQAPTDAPVCASCNLPIVDEPPVYGDDNRPYHFEHSPF